VSEVATGAIVKDFVEAATEMGKYLAAIDADRDEFADASDRLDAAYKALADRQEQSSLIALLNHDDLYVRLYSAKMLLLTDEDRAAGVLDELGKLPLHPNVAEHARFMLSRWRMGKGWLFPTRPDRGVVAFEKDIYDALRKNESG